MSDYFLQKFWQNIKDTSWPEISTWEDFALLDKHIKKECFEQHSLQQRLDEIEDPQHWLPHSMVIFKKDQFVFFNISKCGSTHYKDFFINRLGWKQICPKSIEELTPYIKFGLMMHPLDRYLKGIAQFAWMFDIRDDHIERLVTECFMPDLHSASYTLQFDNLIDEIHWIPFQRMSDYAVKSCMNDLFAYYHSTIRIPTEHPAIGVANPQKKMLQQKITTIWNQRIDCNLENLQDTNFGCSLYFIYSAFAKDLKFYRSLCTHFNPDWSHLKAN